MAGHSKWKNIQHRKGKQDAKKGKIFTKISKEIFVAVRSGGDDPSTNTRLRLALQKAKQNNLPNSNVEQTIKRANGDIEGVEYEEIVYEGYGPSGVAVMVEVLTDNRNRSAADIRFIFSKNGGNLGESGSVSYLFQRKGIIRIELEPQDRDEDDLMMDALEYGAEDISVEDGIAEIVTSPEQYETVRHELEQANWVIDTAEISRTPVTTVHLEKDEADQMFQLIDELEDHDDVQNVHANFTVDEHD